MFRDRLHDMPAFQIRNLLFAVTDLLRRFLSAGGNRQEIVLATPVAAELPSAVSLLV